MGDDDNTCVAADAEEEEEEDGESGAGGVKDVSTLSI